MLWLELEHPEAVPCDRYSLETPTTSTPVTSFSSTSFTITPNSSTSGSNTATTITNPSQQKSSLSSLVKPRLSPTRPKASSRRVSGARVLTSADSLKILEEKALKKKLEQEEKEQ